jgi:hypothetical protein
MKKFLNLVPVLFLILFTSCETESEPPLDKPVVNVSLSEKSPQSEIIVSWTGSENAERYYIERKMYRGEAIENTSITWNKGDPLCITDDLCESGTKYSYVVTACAVWYGEILNYLEKYERSEEVFITTENDPNVTLNYPKNVTVTSDADLQYSLLLNWDSVEGADYYEVYYAPGYNNYYNEKFIKACSTTETSCVKTELINQSSYTFMIKAFNSNYSSLFSLKVSDKVPAAQNLTKDKAYLLEKSKTRRFYNSDETLWFMCTFEKGLFTFITSKMDKNANLIIFDETGNIVASGLPLFSLDETSDKNITVVQNEDEVVIVRNLKNDIKDFDSDKLYFLRVSAEMNKKYSICVE